MFILTSSWQLHWFQKEITSMKTCKCVQISWLDWTYQMYCHTTTPFILNILLCTCIGKRPILMFKCTMGHPGSLDRADLGLEFAVISCCTISTTICIGHYPCSLPALLNGFFSKKKIIKKGPKKRCHHTSIDIQRLLTVHGVLLWLHTATQIRHRESQAILPVRAQKGDFLAMHWGKVCWEASLCSETALSTSKNMSETTFLQSFPRFRSCTPGCNRCRNRDCHHTTLANFIWKIGRAACQGHTSLHMKFCQTLSNILSQSA